MKYPPKPAVWAARGMLASMAFTSYASFIHNVERGTWLEAIAIAFMSLLFIAVGALGVVLLVGVALGLPYPWSDE